MATLAQIMAADVRSQIDDLPTAFVFASVNHTGSLTDLRQEKGMELDGYTANEDCRLTVVLADFASQPIENDTRLITIAGTTYRVSVREDSPNGAEAVLTLRKQN